MLYIKMTFIYSLFTPVKSLIIIFFFGDQAKRAAKIATNVTTVS